MVNFREENSFLIYWVNFFGLHMTIPEKLMPMKWFSPFIFLWTKIPITVLPMYLLRDTHILIFTDMPILQRFAMARKIFVIGGFFLKNVIFYWNKKKIENLIDLWDRSFLEGFYPEEDLVNRRKNLKENKNIAFGSLLLAEAAAISYAVSLFLSRKKQFFNPDGTIDPDQSINFRLAVMFDTCACLSCVSAASFDCILVVFLSQVRSKLEFLQERLADIINEVVIDDEGRLLGRRSGSRGDAFYEETEPKSVAFDRNVANSDRKLRIWIHQHQQAISFFEESKKVYTNIASFELGYIVVYTSLTALHIVQMKLNLVALGIALVASSNLMSLFLWCKLSGDLGNIDSFGEAFDRAWFLFPRKIKTAFSFIIMRSKKPLTLFGFSIFPITLVTFFEILKLTYQFFAFMVRITTTDEE